MRWGERGVLGAGGPQGVGDGGARHRISRASDARLAGAAESETGVSEGAEGHGGLVFSTVRWTAAHGAAGIRGAGGGGSVAARAPTRTHA